MLSQLYAQSVTVLADISGDGTSNGAILSIANRVIAASAVIAGVAFVVSLVILMMTHAGIGGNDRGGGGAATKRHIMQLIGVFVFVEGAIAAVWAIANFGTQLVQGVAS